MAKTEYLDADTLPSSDNDLDIEHISELRREYDRAVQAEQQTHATLMNADKAFRAAGEEWLVERALLKRAIEALNAKTDRIAYPPPTASVASSPPERSDA